MLPPFGCVYSSTKLKLIELTIRRQIGLGKCVFCLDGSVQSGRPVGDKFTVPHGKKTAQAHPVCSNEYFRDFGPRSADSSHMKLIRVDLTHQHKKGFVSIRYFYERINPNPTLTEISEVDLSMNINPTGQSIPN